MPNATVTALVSVQAGGKAIPMKYEKSCSVCRDEYRFDAEKLIMRGRSYQSVVADLPAAEFSEDSLRRHFANGHVPIKQAARQFAAERKSKEITEAVEPVAHGLSRTLAFAQTVVTSVEKRVAAGDLQPTVSDGLAAARFVAEMTEDEDAHQVRNQALQVVLALTDLVQEMLSPLGLWSQFQDRVNASPAISALLAASSSRSA